MCEHCKDLDNIEFEYEEGERFKGSDFTCETCGAEYYEPYQQPILAVNEQARLNHPEIKSL